MSAAYHTFLHQWIKTHRSCGCHGVLTVCSRANRPNWNCTSSMDTVEGVKSVIDQSLHLAMEWCITLTTCYCYGTMACGCHPSGGRAIYISLIAADEPHFSLRAKFPFSEQTIACHNWDPVRVCLCTCVRMCGEGLPHRICVPLSILHGMPNSFNRPNRVRNYPAMPLWRKVWHLLQIQPTRTCGTMMYEITKTIFRKAKR